MSSLAQNASVSARLPIPQPTSPFFTVRLLQVIARSIQNHGWIVFALISLACGWINLKTIASRTLNHDELYTFYIAQAPTLNDMLALTRSVDLHPPLSYLLVRASFAVFGVSSWSCRLPFALAFLATGALLFWLARQMLSPLYGIVALLLFWSVPFTYQADEARPYSLLLCFTAVMLVSWQRATEAADSAAPDRRLALLALTGGGFGLLLSHVLGVLPYAAFFAAEFGRLLIRRKPDWRLWAALLIPAISGLSYLPLIRTHSGITFADASLSAPLRMFAFYSWTIRFLAIPLALITLLAFLAPLRRKRATPDQQQAASAGPVPSVLRPLGFLLCCFSLVPVAVAVLLIRTGTPFFFRYGIVICIPIALVPVLLLGVRAQRSQMVALAVVVLASATIFLNTSGRVWFIEQLANFAPHRAARYVLNALALPLVVDVRMQPHVPPSLEKAFKAARPVSNLDAVDPDLPVVANTGLTFLEVDRQADAALANRFYLLDDRQAALSIAHDTVFQNYDRLTKVFPIRSKVEPYCAFISQHPRFLALGDYSHPQGWLLKKLYADGADLHIVGTYGGLTEDAQLYQVTVTKSACQAQP